MDDFEKYKIRIGLIKWFLSSVVIVIVSLVLESSFKERSMGIEEYNVYNQYVDIILKADNIEERYKLAEYFAIVTPTERLRERWFDYKNQIEKDYQDFIKLKNKEYEIIYEDSTDKNISDIQKFKNKYEKKLMNMKNDDQSAEAWETKGYNYLFSKDVDNAIKAFKNSEDAYNGYHQSYEIYIHLLKNKRKLKDPNSKDWSVLYNDLLTKFSWKMPTDILYQLQTIK